MGLACAVVGRLLDMEKIVMTVPTVLVAIPGSSALRTLLYFDQRDVVSALENGVSTVLVLIAMVAGLACARMLTDPEWAFTRPDPPWGRRLATLSVRRLLPRRSGRAGTGRPEAADGQPPPSGPTPSEPGAPE
nr:threonine/serine exporter family protein [Tessaracoccus coleopterorum]